MERFLLFNCALLLLITVSNRNLHALTRYEDHHWELMLETTLAIQRTALFYKRNFEKVNLDGVFGIRVAEGVLSNVLKQHFKDVIRYPRVYSLLERVYQEIHEGGLQAVRRLDDEGSEYYKMFRSILAERVWYYESPLQHRFNQSLVMTATADDFDEETSDACMAQLLGSQQDGVQQRCMFTDDCWRLMTMEGTSGYSITHQALYFVVADVVGCGTKLKEERKMDVYTELYPTLGSNIYSQMIENLKSKDRNGDLLLEQGLLSHWMGVDPFAENFDLVKMVLKWQDESGCVKAEDTRAKPTNSDGLPGVISQTVARYKGPERRLQYELVLDDGCSSHMTSLYIAYLTLALHWLIVNSPRASSPKPTEGYAEMKLVLSLGVLLLLLFVLVSFKLYVHRFMSVVMRVFRSRKIR